MSENQNRDPALDGGDAEFDARAFGGDVDGPNLVSSTTGSIGGEKEIPIKSAPPETKSLSKKGVLVMLTGFGAVVSAIMLGVGQMGSDRIQDPTAAQSSLPPTTAAGANSAPRIDALLAEDRERRQSGGRGDELELSRNGQPTDDRLANAGGPGATGPSHAEQYRDWLERHRFDRLRAQHMAHDQAHTASLIGESASRNQPTPRPQTAVAAAPQGGFGMGMPIEYTGQPRPERISPEMLAQLAQAQGQGTGQLQGGRAPAGSPVGFAGFQPQGQGQQNRSAQMEAFADSSRDIGYLDQPVRDARPGHEVAAGSIIPAVMLSAINSDLPGSIVAQVRSDVFSTFDFNVRLIPAGSRLIGRYQSDVATGQERVLVAWDELIFPNGRRISLEGMGAVDGQGAAGMRDQVHTHFWRIWGNALMISAIGVAAQQSQPQSSNQNNTPTSSQQAAAAAANSLNETAQQVLRRNLNISPTLEIRPGYTFSVMVNRSISLPAYRD